MKSRFSLVKEMNTDEVIPAKHVTEATLTFQEKQKKGLFLLGTD